MAMRMRGPAQFKAQSVRDCVSSVIVEAVAQTEQAHVPCLRVFIECMERGVSVKCKKKREKRL